MVNRSKQVAPEILVTLQELAAGKPYIAKEIFFWISKIVKSACEHIHATGDDSAEQALSDLMEKMFDVGKEPTNTPFMFSKRGKSVPERYEPMKGENSEPAAGRRGVRSPIDPSQ